MRCIITLSLFAVLLFSGTVSAESYLEGREYEELEGVFTRAEGVSWMMALVFVFLGSALLLKRNPNSEGIVGRLFLVLYLPTTFVLTLLLKPLISSILSASFGPSWD